MASIRQRGKNTWQIRLSLGRGTDGRYKYLSETVHGSRTTALQRGRVLQVEVDEGKHTTRLQKGVSFGPFLEHWLRFKAPGLSPTTTDRYRYAAKSLRPLHATNLCDLTTRDLDLLYADLSTAGKSPATIRKIHNVAHGALRQALAWDLLPSNPAERAEPPPVRQPTITPPTVSEVRALIEGADPDFALLLTLAATTGCRRGELLALRWEDIDFGGLTLRVSRSTTPGGLERPTKSNRVRILALDDSTTAELRIARQGAPPGNRLFPHLSRSDGVGLRFRRLCQRLGITCRFHDLRHFCATQLLAAGVDYVTVSQRLGHSSPAVTMQIYAHPVTEAQERASTIIPGLIQASDITPD